jgi:hypothetical protein
LQIAGYRAAVAAPVDRRDRNGIKDYIADTFACWLNEEVHY